METRSGKIWIEMAKQIYCENGADGYREMGHFPNGAPFLFGSTSRISLTHAGHLLAVATLPKTPEADLSVFSPRTAMGIDAESLGREQVIRVREKFLNDSELAMIPDDDAEANIIAWTCKEALYKAGMTESVDFRKDIEIKKLPCLDRNLNQPGVTPELGKAILMGNVEMELYSYESDGYCVTIAYSPKCAKFGGKG